MAIDEEEAAAAAVSALFFCAALFALVNLRLTGFRLYIPICVASSGKCGGCRASFCSTAATVSVALAGAVDAAQHDSRCISSFNTALTCSQCVAWRLRQQLALQSLTTSICWESRVHLLQWDWASALPCVHVSWSSGEWPGAIRPHQV